MSIPRGNNEIVEIVCDFEKESPTSFMDTWFHILRHLVEDIRLASVVNCRCIFLPREVHENTQGVYKAMVMS
jgi:hypothetical protein